MTAENKNDTKHVQRSLKVKLRKMKKVVSQIVPNKLKQIWENISLLLARCLSSKRTAWMQTLHLAFKKIQFFILNLLLGKCYYLLSFTNLYRFLRHFSDEMKGLRDLSKGCLSMNILNL